MWVIVAYYKMPMEGNLRQFSVFFCGCHNQQISLALERIALCCVERRRVQIKYYIDDQI